MGSSEDVLMKFAMLSDCITNEKITRHLRVLKMFQVNTQLCPGLGAADPEEFCSVVLGLQSILPAGAQIVCECDFQVGVTGNLLPVDLPVNIN